MSSYFKEALNPLILFGVPVFLMWLMAYLAIRCKESFTLKNIFSVILAMYILLLTSINFVTIKTKVSLEGNLNAKECHILENTAMGNGSTSMSNKRSFINNTSHS